MKTFPGVTETELNLLRAILRDALAHHRGTCGIFGSRVAGSFRPNSDLDLWLDVEPALELATLGLLREKLEESPLPFQVDLLEAHRLPPEIASSIRALGPREILRLP